MSGVRCSARPIDLVRYAAETDDVVWRLGNELRNFDDDIEAYLLVTGGFRRMVGHSDPFWRPAFELEDLSLWVGRVGWAFASAGGGSDSMASTLVHTDGGTVDRWLGPLDWNPAKHLQAGKPGDWLRAVDPRCRGHGDESGYRGSGFVIGPDGRSYPLVAPSVVRDGKRYDADDGVDPGQRSVLDLDGRDPGWTTIYQAIGVERWRDAPDLGQRILIGIGSTAAGRPNGSTKSDVDRLVVLPGRAPTFVAPPARTDSAGPAPPYIAPAAPDFPPPRQPDTVYPGGKTSASAGDAAVTLIDGVGGGVMADLGSHAAYDVMFQQNTDGRVRALYKQVYVGFDGNGDPYPVSIWVTGADRNDQVRINYAP